MPDLSQAERERLIQGGAGGAGGESGMGTRAADGGAAAKGQSAEVLAAGDPKKDAAAEAAKQDAAAKADWESFLGKSIGGKLFELIKSNVDPAKLTKYAESGTQSLAKEIGKLGDHVFKSDKAQAEAVNGLLKALAPELKKLADKWLEGPDGQRILKGISDWTEEHPRTVTAVLGTAIIGAAVAAYLSNMDPPALQKMFKLGRGFSAGGSVDIGPIQKLAIQAASAQIEYQSESLKASLGAKMTRADDGKTTTTIEGKAEGQLGADTKAQGTGQFVMNPDGTSTLKVDAGLETKLRGRDVSLGGGLSRTEGGQNEGTEVNGRVKIGDDKQGVSADGKWNPDTSAFSLSLSRTELDGRFKQTASLGQDKDGKRSASLATDMKVSDQESFGHTHTEGEDGTSDSFRYQRSGIDAMGGKMGVNASGTMGQKQALGFGVTFSEGDFKAALDYELKDKAQTLGAKLEYANEEGWKAGMDLKANLDAGRFDHFGFHLGFKDPKQFRSLMLKYDAEWDSKNPGLKHALDLTAEDVLLGVETRLSGKVKWDGQGKSGLDLNLMGAKPVGGDWRAIGGVGYKGEDQGQGFKGGMYLQAGVQYKDVPLVLTFDPGEKKVMLGITIPFGR